MKLLPYRTLTGRTARHADHRIPGTVFACSQCGISKPVPAGDCGTGYARTRKGALVCYACCGVNDRRQLVRESHSTLYLSGGTVSNWPGTLKIPAFTKQTRHNWRDVQRTDCWFTGPDGRQWHGVNLGDNQIVRCRKLKASR